MKKIFLLAFTVLISLSTSFAQGTIRGKVSDKNGETLIGVTIVLKSNPSKGVATDLDGNYSFKITDSTAQTILISYISYQTIEVSVNPKNNEVIIKDFVLAESSQSLGEVEIVAKSSKSNEYYMENIKQNSSTTIDYISAETMKKTGDANVTAAIARVSGVSTNNSGFITVRGIGDRYVKTTVNGLRVPTLDPFTNNLRLDMFPSSLVDNVIITKTASPNLPGDWAGGYISVETKDYPDKLSVNVETSVGYNNQTSFKNILSSQHSATDWLGYDNGFRERNHSDFTPFKSNISQYQQFVALGLGDYFKSMGITGWIDDGLPHATAYTKLGYVQLGLLSKGQFNDPVAVQNAKDMYDKGHYKDQAFNVLNAGAAKTGQSFPNSWNTTLKNAPLDFTQSFSIGNQVNLFGKPLGFLAGFRYGSSTQYDPNATAQRPYPVTGLLSQSMQQQVTRETRGWSALFNLAYKLNSNNSVSILFMPNLTGVNNVRNIADLIDQGNNQKTQFYENRKQLIYQLKSEHYLPASKIKISCNASYTDGKSNAPDFKIIQYQVEQGSNFLQVDPTNKLVDRYYRYLTDKMFDSKVSAEIPLESKADLPRKIIIGGAYQNDNQRSDNINYHVSYGSNTTPLKSPDLDRIMSLDSFGITNNAILWVYNKSKNPGDYTFGKSSIAAGFGMLDYSITPALRVSGGLRVEQAKIYTDIDYYDSLKLAVDDPRRFYNGGGLPILSNPGKLNAISYLPSANIIYKLKNSEEAPMNLRLNFSQTVARPSIRELTNNVTYNYELQAPVMGNPNLKMVQIQNYDLRFESYFKNGDNFSVSLFYKNFKNHIEMVNSSFISWQNVDKSRVLGIELEGKKAITKKLEARANITFVNSQSIFVRTNPSIGGGDGKIYYTPVDTIKRTMFGQSPYIINGILSYNADSLGLILTLSYNVQGPKLALASSNKSIPDVFELPRHLVDFKVTKKLGKHFSTSLTVRNILNAPIKRAYKYPEGYTMTYDKFQFGANFVLALLYKL